jgi:hypothetical protein
VEFVLGFQRRAVVSAEAVGEEGERATIFGSSCLSVPAAALRGLAKVGRPASSRSALSAAKASFGMKISPRTSSVAGILNFEF